MDLTEKIARIDLTMVGKKLMDPEEGPGWTAEKLAMVEIQYRRFLFLTITTADAVPTKDVDAMWHQHILDTRAYARDCQTAFGFFLHHFPYLGMRGPADQALLMTKFQATAATYEQTYGEPYFAARCRGGCDRGRCSVGGCIGSCTNHSIPCPA